MQEKEIKITIKIANRSYPILAKESEIDHIKDTEKRINSELMDYQLKYKKDVQDTLAMLLFLNQAQQSPTGNNISSQAQDKIEEINQQVESYLAED